MKAAKSIGFLAALVPAVAAAADLPYRKGPPVYEVPPPVFTWGGFYVGGYAGGAFSNAKASTGAGSERRTVGPIGPFTQDYLLFEPAQRLPVDPTGFVGGGLLGYNYQFGQFVVGVEGDIGYNHLHKTTTLTIPGSIAPDQIGMDSTYIGRVRGRAGYAFGDTLLYAAGGVSFTNDKIISEQNVPINGIADVSKDLVGFNVGGGLEHAITPNWIFRVEYIYDHFGKTGYGQGRYNLAGLGYFITDRHLSLAESTVRAAIEYKF